MIRKWWKKMAVVFCIILTLGIAAIFGIDFYVKQSVKDQIISVEEAKTLQDVDCILVLGCAVWEGNTPSRMLKDRLDQCVELYQQKAAPKIIMSGDHGREEYDEVNVMKQYAIDAGVKSSDIFMDHAGFSTYESMYRAKEVFQVEKMIVVTQEYHLYRSLYAAEQLGMQAYGVAAKDVRYAGQTMRDLREVLARDKEYFKLLLKPRPTYLGEVIPVDQDGDITNDK